MTGVLIKTTTETAWLAARREGITASEIAIIMGLSPYSSPFALYHQKTGQLPGQDDNLSMAIGRHFEDFTAGLFAGQHPQWAVQGNGRELYAHPERPWQLATPDRLVHQRAHKNGEPVGVYVNPMAVLECKTDGGSDEWGEDGSDEIPVHYRCQVLWQTDVMGVETAFVACLFMNRRQLRVYELRLDDQARADLELMRYEALQFLGRLPAGDFPGEPPEADWRPATRDALKHLHPSLEDRDVRISTQLGNRWLAACRNLKTAEQKKALYENKIRQVLGTGRRAIHNSLGCPVARRDVYDLPEKQITRKASTTDRLVPVSPKEPASS